MISGTLFKGDPMLYYYPNRPTLVAPDPKNPLSPKPDYINGLEALGIYIGEQKFNGDNVYIYTDTMTFWNRHKGLHKYKPSPEVLKELQVFPKASIINAELVHNRTKTVKHHIVCHCVMAWDGSLLLNKDWGYSRSLLESRTYGEHVVLSQIWTKGFWELFNNADGTLIEGIILKNPAGVLKFSTTPIADVPWMLKIRKPCKKYQY
jgi:hypothetical protein